MSVSTGAAERARTLKAQALAGVATLAGAALFGAGLARALPEDYWQQPAASGEALAHLPPLERMLAPQACAQCHPAIYEDWRRSRHAHAVSPGLVAQFPALGVTEANACLQCHAPLAEQRLRRRADIRRLMAALSEPHAYPPMEKTEPEKARPLVHSGVSCAVCHIRHGRRYGPPPKNAPMSQGKVDAPAHAGFIADIAFRRSAFCAHCHQFPKELAVAGKPLQNTLAEWQRTRFAREGVHCQDCHMPSSQHWFFGIHDADFVRRAVKAKASVQGDQAQLWLTARDVGHRFPTYTTPMIIVRIVAMAASGLPLAERRWRIGRRVRFVDGAWEEIEDTRLEPGRPYRFAISLPANSARVRFTVEVLPDAFYEAQYRKALAGAAKGEVKALLARALSRAEQSRYLLFASELAVR